MEKVRLQKQIAEFEKDRMRKNLFGFKDKIDKKKKIIEAINKKKQINMMKEKNFMLKTHNLKQKVGKKKEKQSWMHKVDL